jgi:UDP-N-acetylglucosamine 4-epimerase
VNTVYNTAFGDRNTLNNLVDYYLKKSLSKYDPEIAKSVLSMVQIEQGIYPHSLASIDKAKQLLGATNRSSLQDGLEEAVDWYWKNLR